MDKNRQNILFFFIENRHYWPLCYPCPDARFYSRLRPVSHIPEFEMRRQQAHLQAISHSRLFNRQTVGLKPQGLHFPQQQDTLFPVIGCILTVLFFTHKGINDFSAYHFLRFTSQCSKVFPVNPAAYKDQVYGPAIPSFSKITAEDHLFHIPEFAGDLFNHLVYTDVF